MICSRDIVWEADGHKIALGLDEAGEGPTVLLLPALSSISTRQEMCGLVTELASYFHVISVDWPGFGDKPRPKLDWNLDLLSDYLEFVLREVAPKPFAIVAAGHASTYALDYLAGHPGAAPSTRRFWAICSMRSISAARSWTAWFGSMSILMPAGSRAKTWPPSSQ